MGLREFKIHRSAADVVLKFSTGAAHPTRGKIIMKYLAIDPCAAGGIAYDAEPGIVDAVAMPETVVDLADALRSLKLKGCITAFLEEIPKFAGANGAAMIKLGIRYGEVRGVLAAFCFRVVELPPKACQKTLALGNKQSHGSRWKNHLKERAQALYPHLSVTLKTADALLILEAGKRTTV